MGARVVGQAAMEMMKIGSASETVMASGVSTPRLVKENVYALTFFTGVVAVMIPWVYLLGYSTVTLVHWLFS